MSVVFNAKDHTYVMDGVNLPSVTTVLSNSGIIDSRWFTKSATDRGSKGHQATEFYDEGSLNEGELDEQLKPYLAAWKRFLVDTGTKIIDIEKVVYHPKYLYAGTVDRVALMDGEPCILEIKAGKPTKWHPLQTSAYQQCMKEKTNGAHLRRIIVYLSPDNYKLKEHTNDVEDFAVFSSALRLYRWSLHGGKKK